MNEKGNRYAISALKDKRATRAGEIVSLKRQIRFKEESLVHLDASINLLDPKCKIEDIHSKAHYVRLFKQGELSKLTPDALRRADGKSLPSTQIVTAVLAGINAPESARPSIGQRVKANLAYLRRKGSVEPLGKVRGVRVWAIAGKRKPDRLTGL